MKLKLTLLALALFILAVFSIAFAPHLGVTNFDSVHLRDTGPTSQPVLRVDQLGAGKVAEFLDGGTPVFSINNGGGVSGNLLAFPTPGLRANCKTNTITDTVTYTSTVTAVSTPVYTWCSMNAITGDAEKCAASHATGGVTVIVRNSNATPAANAVGAAVTWCVVGTP
jgi:hypothetical protein